MTEREIFIAALELADPEAQAAYLDEVCDNKPGLRARVQALLQSHAEAGSFLHCPAVASGCFPNEPTVDRSVQAGTRTQSAGLPTQSEPKAESLTFVAPAPRPNSLSSLGHFALREILGRGAFGIVFRAHDNKLEREVALKVLSAPLIAVESARKRFLREARAMARVRHENIVQVYAVEEEVPVPYLVMEYIPGETLETMLIRQGSLEIAEVLRIGRHLVDGLAAAHSLGLIHRDIKPGNILLEETTRKVKLTDFGLARAADDDSISVQGMIAGTPMYMSPEQARGETIDERSDLFSLGTVLYHMVSGKSPFRADSAIASLKRVVEETPRPLREVVPEVPAWLSAVIQKLHAKNPNDRYPSARAVAEALAPPRDQDQAEPVHPLAKSPRNGWSLMQSSLASAAGVGLVLGTLGLVRRMENQPVPTVDPHNSANIAGIHETPRGQDLTPAQAGNLASTNQVAGTRRLPPKPIGAKVACVPLAFSPNGKWLITRDDSAPETSFALQMWEVATGECRATFRCNPKIAPTVGFDASGNLAMPISEDGQKQMAIFGIDALAPHRKWACDAATCFAFDRTGRVLAAANGTQAVILWDIATGKEITRLENGFTNPIACAFSPTDNLLVIADNVATGNLGDLAEPDAKILVFDVHPQSSNYKKVLHSWTVTDFGTTPALRFSRDGALLAVKNTVGWLKGISIYDVSTGAMHHEWLTGDADPSLVLGPVLPDGNSVLVLHGANYRLLSTLEMTNGRARRTHAITSPGANSGVTVNPTGKIICVGGQATPVCLFLDLETGMEFRPHADSFPDSDVARITPLPVNQQIDDVKKALRERNPRFNGVFVPTIQNNTVTGLSLDGQGLVDIGPLRALVHLEQLEVKYPQNLSDLTPLRGLRLKSLNMSLSSVSNLEPLRGMPLTSLIIDNSPVADLSPLEGMPLVELNCSHTRVSSLAPLAGMPLTRLWANHCHVSDLTPLKGMLLEAFSIQNTSVTDFSPLTGIPLKYIYMTYKPKRDQDFLRSFRTLDYINGKPTNDFWNEVSTPRAQGVTAPTEK